MPKINVYLPDDLAAAVKEAGIPVSSVCQRALSDALAAVDHRQLAGGATGASAAPELSIFTNRARHAVSFARNAQQDPTSVDLLDGIVDEGHNLALTVLQGLEVDTADVISELHAMAKKPRMAADSLNVVLQRASEQSQILGHNYVGCEHLLLAIAVGEPGEVSVDTLCALGVDAVTVRRGVVAALAGISYARENGMLMGLSAPIRSVLEEIRSRLVRLESRSS
jgi:hypothetical protein